MNCQTIQKLIPIYLDKELNLVEMKQVKEHIADCVICQKELAVYEASWSMLDELEDIQPSPNYVSRFWTELSSQKKWYERMGDAIKENVLQKRWVPVLATACVMVIVSVVVLQNYSQEKGSSEILAGLEKIDMEMVEDMELAENLDIIEDLEFWEDWEVIENLDV